MKTDEATNLTMPVVYARMLLDLAQLHGATPEEVVAAAGFDAGSLDDPNARVSVLDLKLLLQRSIEVTGEAGLGYEVALESSLLSHGLVGFGMLASASVREAIELGIELLALRVPMFRADLRVEDDTAIIRVLETVPLGEVRTFLFDTFLVKLVRIGQMLTDQRLRFEDVELTFDYPEPAHYAAWKDRLPPMSFDREANELRFPAAIMDRRQYTADPANARLVEEQCRRELADLGIDDDVAAEVRSLLQRSEAGYPSLTEVADSLHTSSRTLKRRLRNQGTTYLQILDDVRHAEATRLVSRSNLTIEEIAHRLGYGDARSLRRAFIGWTGSTPSAFRQRRS